MNKVILIGNLTRDPEMRATPAGVNVCSFSIAVNRRFKNQQGEQETDYFNITAWRALGELCGKYLSKGRKVCVTGELRNRSYEAKDGTKRTVTEITADDVEFLTPRGEGSGTYPQQPTPAVNRAPEAPDGFTDIDDDELPF